MSSLTAASHSIHDLLHEDKGCSGPCCCQVARCRHNCVWSRCISLSVRAGQ